MKPTLPVASAAEALVESRDRPSFGEEQRGAARDAHHAERDDERRQAAPADERAVEQAAADADGERRRQRDDQAVGRPAAAMPSTTPDSATIDPTDRSMPPERITNVMPTATMALMLVCWAMLSRFETVRKCGVSAHSTAHSTSRPMTRAEAARPHTALARLRSQRRAQHALLRGVGGVELRLDAAAVHHENAIAHAEQLGQLRRDHDDAGARAVSRFIRL